MKKIRIAHLSDLHFAKITLNPSQFLSKRWIGNLNLIFFRSRACDHAHYQYIPELLKKNNVKAIFLTGDLTTTALDKEFEEAKNFVHDLMSVSPVYIIPGNHDVYTKEAEKKKIFYHYFSENPRAPYNLQRDHLEYRRISDHWAWIGLDTCIATPPFFSNGLFFDFLETKLESLLESLNRDDHIIMGNHFPLFSTGRADHDLSRNEQLQKLLKKYPQVKIYLHGHDHKFYTINKQEEGLPLSVNSGTCSRISIPSFLILDLDSYRCLIHRYVFKKNTWEIESTQHISFLNPSF